LALLARPVTILRPAKPRKKAEITASAMAADVSVSNAAIPFTKV
jgi:hypothetical protein